MQKYFPEARTVLYGSQARGNATPSSDIDLLILLPDTYQGYNFVNRRNEIMDSLYDIEIEEGIRVSPLVLINKIWEERISQFSLNVRREGITL
ncbi:MAG: nucleotidyltransferase domain-containing protein [Muribaculaceae bacterium]|nr:nucleotidyltransferase domain-containing protein [Muribaculaceae bacterium]MDE6754396.1 nucleotidyltransferase domain-containing protein [Muribaculaceae bacterium]